jgi:predicted dehydrogenase
VLAAVASRTTDRAVSFTAQHTQSMGHARFYGSYQELIDDALVEVVYIPLPTGVAAQWVEKACAQGKHVLVEKPFSSTAEVARLAQSCASAGRQFMDGTMFMHHPRTAELRRQLEGEAPLLGGAVRKVHSVFTFNHLAVDDIRAQVGTRR